MRVGCERACCPGAHPGEECFRCPYREESALWETIRLIRSCSSESTDKDKRTQHYISLEAFRLVLDHPALYGVEDTPEAKIEARDAIQRGIGWLNGEDVGEDAE